MTASRNTDPIVIKKYANRRLYNVTHSGYLTIDDLVELILEGHEVQVFDSRTKEDLTQSVLTQIFLEKNTFLFSSAFLHQLIRNHNGVMGEFFTEFVPKLLDSYLETRDLMRRQMNALVSPQGWMQASTMQNLMNPFASFAEHMDHLRSNLETEGAAAPEAGEPKDVDALQARIRELEREVEELKA